MQFCLTKETYFWKREKQKRRAEGLHPQALPLNKAKQK